MAIKNRELDLMRAAEACQRSSNRYLEQRDIAWGVIEMLERDINRLQKDLQVLVNTIEEHKCVEGGTKVPFHLLSEASAASIFFGD